MNGELLSIAEAARIAGLYPSSLTRAARIGTLEATKVGARAWVVTREALALYLAYVSQRGWTSERRRRGGRPASQARTRGPT